MDNRILRSYIDRAVTALEGIRDALDTANASDPLAMLNQALADGMAPDTMPSANTFAGTTTAEAGRAGAEVMDALRASDPDAFAAEDEPRYAPAPRPYVSNGTTTYLYHHPDPSLVVVLSKDKHAEHGWVTTVQEK